MPQRRLAHRRTSMRPFRRVGGSGAGGCRDRGPSTPRELVGGEMSLPADAYAAAVMTVDAANREDMPLKLLGGQAVRYLTPDFPPRKRGDQDIDLASVSTAKRPVMELLARLGFEGDRRGTIGLARFSKVLADDWGWWRTATGNLDRVIELVRGELARLVPSRAAYDPVEQATALRRHAEAVPKSLRWKVRARLGERVQWYEVPEEVGH